MRRAVPVVLTLLLLALPCLLLLPRLKTPVALPVAALDQLQAARYSASRNRLGTLLIRPLETRNVVAYGDGALPDLAHAPLYTGLAMGSLKALHETKAGLGQRALTVLGIALLLAGTLVTLLLFRQCFPERDGRRAAAFFIWSGGALVAAVLPGPQLLNAALGGLLCVALLGLDVRQRKAPVALRPVALAGLCWGLLYLSLYSALLLLPVLVWHVFRVTRKDGRAVAVFLGVGLLVAAPQLARTYKFAHNPLYHSRWAELPMRTASFPGEQLYHSVSPPRSISAYLAGGGVVELAVKSGRTLTELLPQSVGTFGVALLLFTASGLIRFTDSRVNGLRNLLFLALPLHAIGLSFFFPADECAQALLVWAPGVCVLGAAFLETVIRARRFPRLHARAALALWTLLAGGPGLARLLGMPSALPPPQLFTFPGPILAPIERLQTQLDGILASDSPAELAQYSDIPTAFLPASATDFIETGQRVQKPIVGFTLSPVLRWTRPEETALVPWGEAYRTILGLFAVTEPLPRVDRDRFRQEIKVTYPSALFEALKTFQATPLRDSDLGNDYAAFFWDNRYLQSKPTQ